MREIFISYRRVDTAASAGHLYENLCKAYGEEAVFMDTRGNNIPWGADWQASLEVGLRGCTVLLALIGPQWLKCERVPGQRCLDSDDDWVRNEIITALARGVRVLPILLQDARPSLEQQLPVALVQAGLHRCQAKPVTEGLWREDVDRLLQAIDENPRLNQLHQLHTADTGFRRVGQVMAKNAIAAQTVGRSHQVIETTDRKIDEICLLKGIHDAFHEIEGKCLVPLRGPNASAPRLAQVRKFVQKLLEIRRLRKGFPALGRPVPSMLAYELNRGAITALAALRRATDEPSIEHHAWAVDALEALLGQLPMRLNDEIEHAAYLIELKQVQDLMQRLVDLIGPSQPGDQELAELQAGIQALGTLQVELEARVQEHTWLQGLDNLLRQLVWGLRRAGTGAHMEPAALKAGWNSIRRQRARFSQARTPCVREGDRLLASEEPAIADAVKAGDEGRAAELLADYANDVGELFREVDTQLKEFSNALRTRTESLKLMLRLSQQ